MGRKELVLINLAPASSPCLLAGLLALVLPSRYAPSLQVELVLLASFSSLTGHAITGTGVPVAFMPACGAVGLVWPCKGSEAARLGYLLL